jgi:RHS repeat-associated protein
LKTPEVYLYAATGDKARILQVRTVGILTEGFSYDGEGRLYESTETVDGRAEMKMSYLYDSLDRTKEVRYPAQYGISGSPRKIIEPTYDVASRLSSLKVNSVVQAGDIVYNSSDQTESIKIGVAGANQVTEQYTYDSLSGLLTNQKAIKNFGATNQQSLLDLNYDYAKNNSVGTGTGKTGHLTKTTDNLNNAKNKEYEFDALGRLTKAKGGNNLWTQTYSYDRFGNRLNVVATGNGIDGQPMQKDGIGNLNFGATTNSSLTNRITTTGWEYDVAGNLTRGLDQNGVWLKYEYDAANRLQVIKKDSDNSYVQAFQFGSSNQRLMDIDYGYGYTKIFGGGGAVEYTEFASTVLTWSKSYVYLGDRLLSTITPNGNNTEKTDFNHPDKLGTRIISNQATGTSTEQNNLPFGTGLASESSPITSSKRFTSYERSNATGLDYAINRTYDNKIGRFTQVDPIGMKAVNLEHPKTLNLYNYCGNDPINRTDKNGLFWGFIGSIFRGIWSVLKFVAITIAAFVVTLFTDPLHLISGTHTRRNEWRFRCNAPNYAGLSEGRQAELTARGVSPEQWDGLKNKQRLGYFNIVAAFVKAGLSLAGWLVDWARGGIQQDRTFFIAGAGASNLFAQVSSSRLFKLSNGHEPDYPIGYRFKSFTRSLQLSFSTDGQRIDADIDFFNRRGILGNIFHGFEWLSHKLGGAKTNPYNVRFRESWECT